MKQGIYYHNKINKVRTFFLKLIDQENQVYLKFSNVKLNHLLPKDLMKQYEESFTVSFTNPVITHANKDLNQSNKNIKKDTLVGVAYYSKYIKEIGKDFIQCRKLGVGGKKLECIGGIKKNISIDTELSFIDTLSQIKSSSKSSGKTKSGNVFKFTEYAHKKNTLENLLMKNEEKEAQIIQSNYEILCRIVKKIKISSENIEEGNNSYLTLQKIKCSSKYNEELFERLQVKGINKQFENLAESKPAHKTSQENFNQIIEEDEGPDSGRLAINLISSESQIKSKRCADNQNMEKISSHIFPLIKCHSNHIDEKIGPQSQNVKGTRKHQLKSNNNIIHQEEESYDLSPFHIERPSVKRDFHQQIEIFSDYEGDDKMSKISYREDCETPMNQNNELLMKYNHEGESGAGTITPLNRKSSNVIKCESENGMNKSLASQNSLSEVSNFYEFDS